MIANNYPADPLPTLGMGSIGQNSTFSERGHVAYQNKENQECSTRVANILPADTPTKQNRTWFYNISNKEKRKCSNMVANILPADIPRPLGL